jgi:hypothetical protein
MREIPFVPKADDLALAMSHLAQSSSASRLTAGAAGFFHHPPYPASRPRGLLLSARRRTGVDPSQTAQRPERQLNVDLHQNPTSTLPAN